MLCLLQNILLFAAVSLYFHIGCSVFPSLKKNLLFFSSIILMISGVLGNYHIYIALWVFFLIVLTIVLSRCERINGGPDEENKMGLLYINLASVPLIVFLARNMGNL